MIMIIFKSLCTFFAIYGFVQLVNDLFNSFMSSKRKNNEFMVIIKVKDSENSVEATVRMLVWKFLRISAGGHIPDILIVDMGSSDKTAEIANRLCNDYSFVYYTTAELYEKAKGK